MGLRYFKVIGQWVSISSTNLNDDTTSSDNEATWVSLPISFPNQPFSCIATYLYVIGHGLNIKVIGFRYRSNEVAIFGYKNQYMVRSILLGY